MHEKTRVAENLMRNKQTKKIKEGGGGNDKQKGESKTPRLLQKHGLFHILTVSVYENVKGTCRVKNETKFFGTANEKKTRRDYVRTNC